jgi:hypothetical protein
MYGGTIPYCIHLEKKKHPKQKSKKPSNPVASANMAQTTEPAIFNEVKYKTVANNEKSKPHAEANCLGGPGLKSGGLVAVKSTAS